MSRFEITFTAVMGTIIIHLVVAVIFISVKISALHREMAAEIILAFDQERTLEEVERAIELAAGDLLQDMTVEEMVNIIKNLADNPTDIDPKEYEKMVMEEMVKSGLLEEKNFIEERDRADEWVDEIAVPHEKIEPNITEKSEKPEERGTFAGPTRIYYELAGRHHIYLPIPIYKCEGAGQITMAIVVDRNGRVLKAEPASRLSNTRDPCLTETAREHALKTLFNKDESAPERQAGYLTFVFVAQ